MKRVPGRSGDLVIATLTLMTLLVFLTPSPARAKDEKEVGIWSTVPFFHWIRQTAEPLDQFSFFIDGVQADASRVKAVKFKDSLHVRFPLALEKHTRIEVRLQGQHLYDADLFYAPAYAAEAVPEESNYQPFHTKDNERPCQGCHRLTVTPADYDPRQVQEQVCYPCHQSAWQGEKSQHKPAVVQWRCLQCHRAEARPSQWSPNAPLRFALEDEQKTAPLCYKCHKKLEEQVKGYGHMHGPIGMGGCTLCHDPHAAPKSKLLHHGQPLLCVNCHDLKAVLKKPVIHQVIKTKGCTACHQPHGDKYKLQLAVEGNDLCYSCHPTIRKAADNHPIQGHPVFVKASGSDKKDKLTCVSCHSPHASDFPNLLPEGELMMLCNRCHPKGSARP